MAQGVWATDTSSAFDFLKDADDALKAYLDTSGAPGNIVTFLSNEGLTVTKDPRPAPQTDDSLSNLPLCHLWTTGFDTPQLPAFAVRPTTRLLVWVENNDPITAANTMSNLSGAIASAIQQTRDTSGNDWADFFCNHDQPTVTIDGIEFVEFGETQGLVQGQVSVVWTHTE